MSKNSVLEELTVDLEGHSKSSELSLFDFDNDTK